MGDILTPSGILTIIGIIAAGVCTVLIIDRKTMREGMDDLRARVTDLEKERDDLRTKVLSLTAEVLQKTQDIDAVVRTVTGEAHWVAIEVLIRDLIDRFNKLTEKVNAALRRMEAGPK